MRHRISPRHKKFDYTNNATYFVTICTYRRIPYFWISKQSMQLSNIGIICKKEIEYMVQCRSYIIMHEYVIMHDHIHLLFTVNVGTGFCLS